MSKSKDEGTAQKVLKQLEKSFRSFHPLAPLEQLVFAVLQEGDEPEDVYKAIKSMMSTFVDWNEARVARISELARAMHILTNAENKARRMREMLRRLFDLQGSMNLAFLANTKPAEARRMLINLDDGIPRPVISIILFEVCPGATIPLSPEALKLARKHGLISRTGSKADLQKTLQAELDPQSASRLVQYLEFAATGKDTGKSAKPPKKRRK